MNNQRPERPWIIAHRGAMHDAPENTHAAFRAALRYPIDGIETDVQLTKDGAVVLFHDPTLSKVSGSARSVSETRLRELERHDWGAWFSPVFRGQRLVTLEQLLRAYCPRTRLLVEIKSFAQDRHSGRSFELTKQVLATLQRMVPMDRVGNIFVLSFDADCLEFAANEDPNWRYVLNVEDPQTILDDTGPAEHLSAYCGPIDEMSSAIVDRVHEWGREVMTYSCNTPEQVDKAFSDGVDVMMTDRPSWVFDYLRTRDKM